MAQENSLTCPLFRHLDVSTPYLGRVSDQGLGSHFGTRRPIVGHWAEMKLSARTPYSAPRFGPISCSSHQ